MTHIAAVICLMMLSWCIIAFTGLKKTIPGYPSVNTELEKAETLAKMDSLQRVIDEWEFQMGNIQRIVNGRDPLPLDSLAKSSPATAKSGNGTK